MNRREFLQAFAVFSALPFIGKLSSKPAEIVLNYRVLEDRWDPELLLQEDTIINLIAKQAAEDLEELAVMGRV